MHSNPVISVIIPCFNAQATIKLLLDSLGRLGDHSEIIVVNDGSTDHSLEAIKSSKTNVKLVSTSNCGVSHARNLGFSLSSGSWIQFIDADDLSDAKSIEGRLALSLAEHSDVCISDWDDCYSCLASSIGSDCLRLNRRSADWHGLRKAGSEIACATTFWAPPAAILYKRSIVLKIGGFRADLPIIQDARFLFDAAYQGARFTHLSSPGAIYRISAGSLSRQSPNAFWLDCLRNGQQIEQLWIERDRRLNQNQMDALQQIYIDSAGVLIRAGHPAAFQAAEDLQRIGGKLNRELSCGLQMLRVAGSPATRAAFTLGRTARALGRRLRQRQGEVR